MALILPGVIMFHVELFKSDAEWNVHFFAFFSLDSGGSLTLSSLSESLFHVVIIRLEIIGDFHLVMLCECDLCFLSHFIVSHRMDTEDKKTIVEAP